MEIFCLEIGLEFEGENGTIFLQERGLKSPRMMKVFSLALIEQYPTVDLDQMKIVGIVISGKNIYIYIYYNDFTYSKYHTGMHLSFWKMKCVGSVALYGIPLRK